MGSTLLQELYFRLHKRISMLGLFYQYLIVNNKIVLPGLGTVVVHRQPSTSDFTEHAFLPPSYNFQWQQVNANPPKRFFIWLAHKLNIAEEDAAIQVNSFITEVKRELNAGKEINWNGVGIIRRGFDSSIELETETRSMSFEKTIHGEKVIHHDSSHSILVGDKEKTNVEMTEILALPEPRRINWYHIAIAIAIAALLFTGGYFWKNGFTTGSVSRQKKITPAEAPATYKELK